jgi:hypothetical protein
LVQCRFLPLFLPSWVELETLVLSASAAVSSLTLKINNSCICVLHIFHFASLHALEHSTIKYYQLHWMY